MIYDSVELPFVYNHVSKTLGVGAEKRGAARHSLKCRVSEGLESGCASHHVCGGIYRSELILLHKAGDKPDASCGVAMETDKIIPRWPISNDSQSNGESAVSKAADKFDKKANIFFGRHSTRSNEQEIVGVAKAEFFPPVPFVSSTRMKHCSVSVTSPCDWKRLDPSALKDGTVRRAHRVCGVCITGREAFKVIEQMNGP